VTVINNGLYYPAIDGIASVLKSQEIQNVLWNKYVDENINNYYLDSINKDNIIACQIRDRIFYACKENGSASYNVILVYETANRHWSRLTLPRGFKWLETAKINAKTVLVVIGLDNFIYKIDTSKNTDDWWDGTRHRTERIRFNILSAGQGSSRSKNQYTYLVQEEFIMTNFYGSIEFGVIGVDVYGRHIDRKTVINNPKSKKQIALAFEEIINWLRVDYKMQYWQYYVRDCGKETYCHLNNVTHKVVQLSNTIKSEFGDVDSDPYRNQERYV
jgi:hypothetical protein